jgi:hypothetical protein
MFYKLIKPDINLNSIEDDLRLNSEHVKIEFNKRALLVHSNNISKIIDIVINNLKNETMESFDVYAKNIFGYTQAEGNNQTIEFTKQLKDDINLIAKYSFIFFTKSFDSKIFLGIENSLNGITIVDGDLLIFKTEDFLKDVCLIPERIGIYGSLTNEIYQIETNKSLI